MLTECQVVLFEEVRRAVIFLQIKKNIHIYFCKCLFNGYGREQEHLKSCPSIQHRGRGAIRPVLGEGAMISSVPGQPIKVQWLIVMLILPSGCSVRFLERY